MITPEEQADEWHRCGMEIPDRESAVHFLRHTGAGILREYALPFLDSASGRFPAGTGFWRIVDIFEFDRKLRMTVLDAALRLEVSVRAQMEAYGALPGASARDRKSSFGKLSRGYASLPFAARQQIAAAYGMDAKVLKSFLGHLTIVRNCCAHNGRLWGFEFGVKPALPAKKPMLKPFFNYQARGKIHNTLVILVYLTNIISPRRDWRRRLLALLQTRGDLPAAMGFPHEWRASAFWRGKQTPFPRLSGRKP